VDDRGVKKLAFAADIKNFLNLAGKQNLLPVDI
jgi:hypothetical protein